MRFSDLVPGFVIRTPPRLITANEMIEFASRYDPQSFHVDPQRACEGRWKGLNAMDIPGRWRRWGWGVAGGSLGNSGTSGIARRRVRQPLSYISAAGRCVRRPVAPVPVIALRVVRAE